MIKQIVSCSVLLFSVAGFAQEEQVLDDVTVEGKSISLPFNTTSQSIQIITKEEIKNSPVSSVEELLSYQAGIDIRQRGTLGVQADVSIRGGSFEQVLILINGIRLNDAQTGHNMMHLPFNLSSVERIEIVKGPSARRYGQNAFSGVINIITKVSEQNNFNIELSGAEYNTYDLNVGVNLGGDKINHYIQAGIAQSDGYRHNTDFNKKNIWYQNQIAINKGNIRMQAGISEKKFGANGFYATPSATEQYEELQASLVSVTLEKTYDKLSLNSHLYWRRGQDMYLFVRDNPSLYRNMHIGNNMGWESNFSYRTKAGITGIGFDLRKETLRSSNLGTRDHFVTAVFAEHRFLLAQNKLDITPGISWTNYSDFGNFWYPGIDIGFKINERNKLYVNAGKTFRVPTFTDLYYTSATEQGSASLKPEEAISFDAGYRYSGKNILASAGFFMRNSSNLIDWVKENQEDKWTAQNIAKVQTKGLEANIDTYFRSFIRSVSLGYTYIDNDLKEIDKPFSRYALDNLKHQLVIKSEQKIGKYFINKIVFRYNDRVTLSNYHVLGNRLSFVQNNKSFFIQLNNITNTKYTETNLVPMPGRWLHAGVSFNGSF